MNCCQNIEVKLGLQQSNRKDLKLYKMNCRVLEPTTHHASIQVPMGITFFPRLTQLNLTDFFFKKEKLSVTLTSVNSNIKLAPGPGNYRLPS